MKLYAYEMVIETYLPEKGKEVFLSMYAPDSGKIVKEAVCVGTVEIKPLSETSGD